MGGDAHVEEMGEDGGVLRIVQHVEASPAKVWNCFVSPPCFKAWWRENIEFDPQVGGRFREPWRDQHGRDRLTEAQVTAFHPPHGMVMVWADEDWTFDTIVSLTLEAEGTGCRVTVEHQGWHEAPEAERAGLLDDHRDGWTARLANLAHHAEDHTEEYDAPRKGH